MKAFAFSTRIIFFWLFLFSAAMAEEENQEKELLHGQNDQTMPQQGLVSDGVHGRADSRAGPKRVWPEVVGLTAEEAEKKIKEEMPMAQFQVVPPGCFVTMDFNSRRVRLFMDSSNKVAQPPRIG